MSNYPDPMKQCRKRVRDHDHDHDPETTTERDHKQRRLETLPSAHSATHQEKPLPEPLLEASPEALPEASLPTPAYSTTSPKHHVQSASNSHRRHRTAASEPVLEAPEQSIGQRRLKRQLDESSCDPLKPKRRRRSTLASEPQPTNQDNWFIDHWQSKTAQELAALGTLEGQEASTVQDTAEGREASLQRRNLPPSEDNEIGSGVGDGPYDWQDEESEQMSQSQDGGSSLSEKLKTGRPIYRVALKMNRVTIDNDGSEIPSEVEKLVATHIRKQRTSPRLKADERVKILNTVKLVWDSPEPVLDDLVALPILPLGDLPDRFPSLAYGGNTLWSRAPLPSNAQYPLVTPKTDKHLGYHNSLRSRWKAEELMAADHPIVRPYSQPAAGNMFPSFLCEVKSEAMGGTLYAADAQLATAGFHRVRSMIWILDQIDSRRTRKSSDAIIFSAALSQRQLVAYVHYYDPVSDTFRMSFVDSFYLFKELQACVDFSRNTEDWMVNIQEPAVRKAMRDIYPTTQLWIKGRPTSVVAAEEGASFGSEEDRTAKTARME